MRRRVRFLAACCGVLLALGWPAWGAPAPAETPQDATPAPALAPRDVVIVVDVSRSMDDIFGNVQAAVQEFLDNARPADRFTLVTFSDGVQVVRAWQDPTPEALDAVKAAVAELQPNGRFTNITAAVRRSVRLLREAAQRDETGTRVRLVLLITDGRHNPPNRNTSPTFDSILQRYGDFRSGKDWFVHYIAVREIEDDETLEFVRAAGGQISLLNEQRLDELAARMDELETPVPMTLRAVDGAVSVVRGDRPLGPGRAGQALFPGDVLLTGARGRAIVEIGTFGVVGVDPSSRVEIVRVNFNPIRNLREAVLRVEAGAVYASVDSTDGPVKFLVETPQTVSRVTGTVLVVEVSPAGDTTRVGVLEGSVDVADQDDAHVVSVLTGSMTTTNVLGRPGEPAPLSPALREFWGIWQMAMDGGSDALGALAGHFVRARWESLRADLGPLTPGTSVDEQVSVGLGELSGFLLRTEIIDSKVPPAIQMSVRAVPGPAEIPGAPAVITVTAAVPEDVELHYNDEYTARVQLSSTGLPANMHPTFPITVSTGPRPAGLAGRAATVPTEVWRGLLAASTLGPLVLYGLYRVWSNSRIALPLGRLLLTRNPAPDRWDRTAIDLEKVGHGTQSDAITIGRAADNVLALPDDTLQPYHTELRVTGRRKANRRLIIVVKQGADVRINGERVNPGSIQLLDKMRVQVGDFEFLYEDTKYYQQVEVATRNQEVLRGVLHSWDLRMSDFLLALEDTDLRQETSPELVIKFSDVETITVFKAPRRRRKSLSRKARGAAAVVHLHSGRQLQGWLRRDYNTTALRFYFFPENQPEVDYVIVERASVTRIETPAGMEAVRTPASTVTGPRRVRTTTVPHTG